MTYCMPCGIQDVADLDGRSAPARVARRMCVAGSPAGRFFRGGDEGDDLERVVEGVSVMADDVPVLVYLEGELSVLVTWTVMLLSSWKFQVVLASRSSYQVANSAPLRSGSPPG